MRSLFTLALFTAIVVAKKGGKSNKPQFSAEDDAEFTSFAAKNNKNYKTKEEFGKREKNWKDNDDYMQVFNKASKERKANGVKLAHNWTTDLDQDEYAQLLGVTQDEEELKKATKLEKGKGKGKGRKLQSYNVNHAELGNMTPVKDQGRCGSCWAFTATSVLEGTIAALDSSFPVRLSEQQLVDCSTTTPENIALWGGSYGTSGCQGGWMDRAWWFSRDQGTMTNADYPYVSGTNGGIATSCTHDANKAKKIVAGWAQVTGTLEDVQQKLVEQPLSFAMNAGDRTFQMYSEGVYDGLDENGLPIATTLNHAMTIVGFNEGGEGATETQTSFEYKYVCQAMYGFYYCGWVVEEVTVEVPAGEPHWIVQNSWTQNWGAGGFIKIAMEGGAGIGGMNQVIQYVIPN